MTPIQPVRPMRLLIEELDELLPLLDDETVNLWPKLEAQVLFMFLFLYSHLP